MPLRYDSDLAEHHAVRRGVGLFDLSHMGEVWVEGPGAAAALDFALVGHASLIGVGRAKYSMLCAADGGILDDLVVYRPGETRFLVVANAGNADLVSAELATRCHGFECAVRDEGAATALVAVQGPRAGDVIAAMMGDEAPTVLRLPYYSSAESRVGDVSAMVARTGYTGEDGFEFFCAMDDAVAIWDAALASGAPAGIVPCGLAARDTLRLEAGMPLYGHELTLEITPFDAGLGRVVHFGTSDRPHADFIGRAALESARSRHAAWDSAPTDAPLDARVLVGLVGEGRRSPRAGYTVTGGGTVIGEVTSGAPSPTLGRSIAMAYVHPSVRAVGTELDVDVRGRVERMSATALPFYQRSR